MPLRYWILTIFVVSAAHANLRGRVRLGWLRAMTDFPVLLAPLNALMYLASRVRATPYVELRQFPELDTLQAHWQEIREEAVKLNDEGMIRAAAGYTDLGFNSFFRTGWTRFYLKWYGTELASAQALCPRTVELLAGIPSVKAAMFASLPPGSRLVRHRDPYAGSLRYHLGLTTPNSPACYIEVDGQRHHWTDGGAVMFDETFVHFAENTTQEQRVILFCDIERPLRWWPLGALNRWFARHVMSMASTRNVEGEPIGALNRFFTHAYKARVWGKEPKRRSRPTYYVLKWALIGGLLAAIFV